MATKPKPESDEEREFNRVLSNMLKAPPKPHEKPQDGRRRGRPIGS